MHDPSNIRTWVLRLKNRYPENRISKLERLLSDGTLSKHQCKLIRHAAVSILEQERHAANQNQYPR